MITMWDDFKTAVQAIDLAALDRTGLGDLAGEIGATRAVLDGLEARTAVDRDAGLLAEAESLPADVASSKTRDWVRRRQTDDDLQRPLPSPVPPRRPPDTGGHRALARATPTTRWRPTRQ